MFPFLVVWASILPLAREGFLTLLWVIPAAGPASEQAQVDGPLERLRP